MEGKFRVHEWSLLQIAQGLVDLKPVSPVATYLLTGFSFPKLCDRKICLDLEVAFTVKLL